MQLNHLPENIECFKVFDNKAYFQIKGVTCFYEFENNRQADIWKSKRSIENRKSKTFEYFMAVNERGDLDYAKLYRLHSSIGIVAPEPYCLQMLYALDAITGKERDYTEENDAIAEMLSVNQRARIKGDRKAPTSFVTTDNRKYRLKQLTDASALPEFMGELLLSEIKLSNDAPNEHLRTRVKLLGLW